MAVVEHAPKTAKVREVLHAGATPKVDVTPETVSVLVFKILFDYYMDLLQANWNIIKEEASTIWENCPKSDLSRTRDPVADIKLSREVDGNWVRGWTDDTAWLNFGLIYNRTPMLKNCYYAGMTYRILENFNDIEMAGFSMLAPGGIIPPHKDEESGSGDNVLHLGLDVPEKCILIVDGTIHTEENGKVIKFNDSLEHAALNKSDKNRMILYIKFLSTS